MAKKNFKGSGADFFLTSEPATTAIEATTKELVINPVFQSLIPPLSEEEHTQLEENLLANGIREAISVWSDTIIDGHNRYAIAKKHNLTYTTVSYEFDNEDDVKLWIFNNQIGRRNLPSFERVRLALTIKPVIAEKAKAQQIRKSANSVLQISAKQNPIDTRKIIADIAGVSHDTVSKVEKILDSGTPETLEKIKRGEITVNKAYQDTRSQEKKNSNAACEPPPLSASIGTFSVIYADPPWEQKFSDLKKIEIPTSDNAALFLWSCTSTLDKALQLMNTWGFKYQTNMVWDKQPANSKHYLQWQHEILLIGTKGNFTPAIDVHISPIYSEELNSQNAKPKWFYEQIERMFPNEKYLELFTSSKYNENWVLLKNLTEIEEADSK